MYTLGLTRQFEASHALTGGDWGAENEPHSHHYRLELTLEGEQLDEHGFLVDIVAVTAALDQVLARYRAAHLNELEEFQGLNPSVEHFARILAEALAQRLPHAPLAAIGVQLWESESAWARYRLEF